MRKLILLFILMSLLNSCTQEPVTAPSSGNTPITPTGWTGTVISSGYVHSLLKIFTLRHDRSKDSSFQDSNPDNALYGISTSIIKIGKTFDSLSNGDKNYWTPQNGFIVYDLTKHFGGRVSNIRTANLKIKLYKNANFTNELKFVVSVMDTTILTKSIKERIEAVQSSTGEAAGYLTEFTLDLKNKFSTSGKVVIGIKAENPAQLFASVQYCKIEFDGDVVR